MKDPHLSSIYQEVRKCYLDSPNECMREWFFNGHVDVVVRYAKSIAEREGARGDISVLASLFHDIARAWEVTDDPELMEESVTYARKTMQHYEYSQYDIEDVEHIIRAHGCKELMPETPEGKVMATADAMAHLMTDFYFILPFYGWLTAASDFEGYRQWLLKKIERDFRRKIFFETEQSAAQPRFTALKTIFSINNSDQMETELK